MQCTNGSWQNWQGSARALLHDGCNTPFMLRLCKRWASMLATNCCRHPLCGILPTRSALRYDQCSMPCHVADTFSQMRHQSPQKRQKLTAAPSAHSTFVLDFGRQVYIARRNHIQQHLLTWQVGRRSVNAISGDGENGALSGKSKNILSWHLLRPSNLPLSICAASSTSRTRLTTNRCITTQSECAWITRIKVRHLRLKPPSRTSSKLAGRLPIPNWQTLPNTLRGLPSSRNNASTRPSAPMFSNSFILQSTSKH